MRKTSWDSLKAFAIELVRKKTKAEQKKSEPSFKAFVAQLAIFTALVVSYFFLVLSFLSHWLNELFDQNKLVYAIVTHAIKGNVDIMIALVMHTGAAVGAQIGVVLTRSFVAREYGWRSHHCHWLAQV